MRILPRRALNYTAFFTAKVCSMRAFAQPLIGEHGPYTLVNLGATIASVSTRTRRKSIVPIPTTRTNHLKTIHAYRVRASLTDNVCCQGTVLSFKIAWWTCVLAIVKHSIRLYRTIFERECKAWLWDRACPAFCVEGIDLIVQESFPWITHHACRLTLAWILIYTS